MQGSQWCQWRANDVRALCCTAYVSLWHWAAVPECPHSRGVLEGKRTIWKTARCFVTPASPRAWAARRPRDGVTPSSTAIGAVSCPRRNDKHDDRHVVATGEVSDGH